MQMGPCSGILYHQSSKYSCMYANADAALLQNGEPVEYRTTQGERLLGGVVMIDESPGGQCGILCDCCATVVSCSQFEAHAGRPRALLLLLRLLDCLHVVAAHVYASAMA
jgi:Tify domain binding domain